MSVDSLAEKDVKRGETTAFNSLNEGLTLDLYNI